MIFFILVFLHAIFLMPLSGKEANLDQKIVVRLDADSQLTPVFLGKFLDEGSGFQASYLEDLEKILRFDLSCNGFTQLLARTQQRDSLIRLKNFSELGVCDRWKQLQASHVIEVQVKDKQIYTRLLSVRENSIKMINGLVLTGNLDQDRRQIHALADALHKELFGVNGIASTRILYTVKAPFSGSGKKWTSEVWEADYDGANARKVNNSDSGYCVTPRYVPSKQGYRPASFFYVSYKEGQPKIYVASLKEGNGRRFSLLKGNQLMPAISLDCDKVAFISDITGNPDLFLQQFSMESGPIGKPRQIYTTYQATQGSPAFSPDGSQIAFVSNKDGSARVYVMTIPPVGTPLKKIQARLISQANAETTAPSWSPDGKKLAYSARCRGKERQIWIYDFDRNEEWPLTEGEGNKENPSWAPNSLHLVFNSTGRDKSELYMINLSDREAVKISTGPGEKRFPCWEPLKCN